MAMERTGWREATPTETNKPLLQQNLNLDLAEVVLGLGGLHGPLSGLPASGAHLVRVGLDVLDGLQHTLGLLHAAAEAQVVDGGVLQRGKEGVGY